MATTEQLQEQLDAAYATRLAILQRGQSIGEGGRSLDRAELAEVNSTIERLEGQVARATRGGMRMRQGVPL